MADFSPLSFQRTRLDPANLPAGAVIIDQQRERTRWSEGMFVTAAQFNRDQSYLLERAGDLGRIVGPGVVDGLEVSAPPGDRSAVIVRAGLGLTASGASVVLHGDVRVPLGDALLSHTLEREAGLTGTPQFNAESRAGVFALCAMPVEYTSNPVASYATGPNGERTLNDGVVTEAVLFILVPFALGGRAATARARQAAAARKVFLDGAVPDVPSSALPLALLELDGSALVWLDSHLARRAAGGTPDGARGLGTGNPALRRAHMLHYDAMLSAIVDAAPGRAFAAADVFDVLPAMGRMPSSTVAPRRPAPGATPVLSHGYLPSEMPVELVVLPEDELAQLLEESVSLPPIDLSARREVLANTPVSVIVPVPRAEFAAAPTEVTQAALTLEAARPLGTTPQTPMALIEALLDQARDPALIDPTVSAAWLKLLGDRRFLWYMRRRQFLRTDALAGEAYAYQADPPVPNGDGNDNGNGGPGPGPGPALPAEDAAGFVRTGDIAVERGLARWGAGLLKAYEKLRPPNTRAGRPARAALNGALGVAIANGSPLAASSILHLFAAQPDSVEKVSEAVAEMRLDRGLAPQEGLLLGGLIDVVIPAFKGDASAVSVGAFAPNVNFGVAADPEERAPLPADFQDNLRDLLEDMEMDPDAIERVFLRGGGTVEGVLPRDLDGLRDVMKRSAERNVPLIWRVRDPGSAEAQTRRNLVAATLNVLPIAEVLQNANLTKLVDPVIELIATIDTVLDTPDASIAVAKVKDALAGVMSELGL